MAGDNYFLLTSLPSLGDIGSAPPISPAELLERVAEAEGSCPLIEALFLSDDLLQRQALLASEIQKVDPAVLTVAQTRNEEPLPDFAETLSEEHVGVPVGDILWESYFRHVASTAASEGSGFLQAWVRYEVSLRNALALARAKALNLDPQSYLVAADLGGDEGSFSSLLSEWSATADPLAGVQVLDRARWRWIGENDGWFTFEDDEVVAYAAKLMLLQRWKRLSKEAIETRTD